MNFLENELNETVAEAQDHMIEATETETAEAFDFNQEAAEAFNVAQEQ